MVSVYTGPLKQYIIESSGTPTHSFIFLHGYDCSGEENVAHCTSWFHANITKYEGLRVICPDAFFLETSAPGYGDKRVRSWYDFYDGNCTSEDDKPDLDTLIISCAEIHAIINAEVEIIGCYSRILLGGVSQGCCAAFHALTTFKQPIGGFYGSIGHIMPCTDISNLQAKVLGPIMFFSGSDDPVYPWSWVKNTFARLRGVPGVDLWREDGVEHEDDGHWISIFLSRILPPPGISEQLSAYEEKDKKLQIKS